MRKFNETPDPSERTVLVIGGAGYVGSVLVRSLLDAGYRVRSLDCFLYRNSLSVEGLYDADRFEFVHGDLRDPEVLDLSLDGVTDVVLLASLVGDPISKKYPDLTHDVNMRGSMAVFQALEDRGIERFVFTSTCSNYGLLPEGEIATEETDLHPLSIYAETKVTYEKFVLENAARMNFSSTVLRIATAYGLSPRMRFDLTVNEFVYVLASGKPLKVYDKDTWRPYCHVRDISAAIIRVLEAPTELINGEVFNVGNDENNFTKAMLVDEILKSVDGEVEFVEGSGDPRNYRVSFRKIQERLDYAPQNSVRSFIPQLASAVQAQLFLRVNDVPGYYGNLEIDDRWC